MASDLENLLIPPFPKKHVAALIAHYQAMSNEFQKRQWENCLAKSGKFVEAGLKALHVCAFNQPALNGKAFKVDGVINSLSQTGKGTIDDTIRILIPRACRFVYEIASNRGGRHDPDEIDPNEMDAATAMSLCSWILAEMIRFSQKGIVNLTAAKDMVSSLIEKKYSIIEEVDGHIYFHKRKKSALDVALVVLAKRYPTRVPKQDLIEMVKRNGFKQHNSEVAVSRAMKHVDENAHGLRLLAPGLAIAEKLLSS